MVSNLDRFKVMLEEHRDGGITQREYALRDFLGLFNDMPGHLGRGMIEKNVEPSEERTCIGTLPKGSKVSAFAIRVNEWPEIGDSVQLGTEDDPAHFGELKISDGEDDESVLQDWHDDSSPLEEDTEVFLTIAGFDKQKEGKEGDKDKAVNKTSKKAAESQKAPPSGGCMTVVVNYEKLNSFDPVV